MVKVVNFTTAFNKEVIKVQPGLLHFVMTDQAATWLEEINKT